jgi:hypothetical protein
VSAAEDWDGAPCGLLTLHRDGTILAANRTLLAWVGRSASDVVGRVRLSELLSVGGRIFWETHLFPILRVEDRLDEVSVELRGPVGRIPVLMSAVAEPDGEVVRVALSGARDRRRFEHELQAARDAAERSATQLLALQTATAALSGAMGVRGVADALLTAALGALGGEGATLWTVEDERLSAYGTRGEVGADVPPTRRTWDDRVASRTGNQVVVPLRGRSGLRGVLSVREPAGVAADPLDLDVFTAVGQQAGLALDRARLYEHSAGVAHQLQHAMLAVEPPPDPRYAMGATYRAGVEMLEVGGDWYDVFSAGPDVLAFVVGDVVGRGLGAASAMGQLRSAVRAVAGPGVGPAALLTRLDRFVEQVPAARMATVAYAELDLADGMVRYACAGHPPPLLLPVDGDGRYVWGGRSMPLGVGRDGVARTQAEQPLEAGDRLLLYTDGLVERRDRGLDEGFEVLAGAAALGRGRPLDAAVRQVTETMLVGEEGSDDVCALLLSWSGPDPRDGHTSPVFR